MAILAEDAQRFHNRGRDIVTNIAKAMDEFNAYARVFEVRGGRLELGDEWGLPTEALVVLRNELAGFFTTDRQAILDKYREDY